MKRVHLILFVIGVIAVTLATSSQASAHVLIKSTDASSAAILHVMPDDDPIAGEQATLMLDTQGGVLRGDSVVRLVIRNIDTGTSAEVPATIDRSLVSSKYVFPVQGVYTVDYEITSGSDTVSFEQTQRITRGVVGAAAVTTTYVWAEALLFVAGALIVVLGIVAWNNRKQIFKSSVL